MCGLFNGGDGASDIPPLLINSLDSPVFGGWLKLKDSFGMDKGFWCTTASNLKLEATVSTSFNAHIKHN